MPLASYFARIPIHGRQTTTAYFGGISCGSLLLSSRLLLLLSRPCQASISKSTRVLSVSWLHRSIVVCVFEATAWSCRFDVRVSRM